MLFICSMMLFHSVSDVSSTTRRVYGLKLRVLRMCQVSAFETPTREVKLLGTTKTNPLAGTSRAENLLLHDSNISARKEWESGAVSGARMTARTLWRNHERRGTDYRRDRMR